MPSVGVQPCHPLLCFFFLSSFSMASSLLAARLHAIFAVYRLHATLFYQFLWSTTCISWRAHGLLQLANLVTLVVRALWGRFARRSSSQANLAACATGYDDARGCRRTALASYLSTIAFVSVYRRFLRCRCFAASSPPTSSSMASNQSLTHVTARCFLLPNSLRQCTTCISWLILYGFPSFRLGRT